MNCIHIFSPFFNFDFTFFDVLIIKELYVITLHTYLYQTKMPLYVISVQCRGCFRYQKNFFALYLSLLSNHPVNFEFYFSFIFVLFQESQMLAQYLDLIVDSVASLLWWRVFQHHNTLFPLYINELHY